MISTGITTGFIPHIIPMHASMYALPMPASLRLCRGFCGWDRDLSRMKVGHKYSSLASSSPQVTFIFIRHSFTVIAYLTLALSLAL